MLSAALGLRLMRRMVTRAQAQSFDRVAEGYHQLGGLTGAGLIDRWLTGLLPAGRAPRA